jgi:hypothetical protein
MIGLWIDTQIENGWAGICRKGQRFKILQPKLIYNAMMHATKQDAEHFQAIPHEETNILSPITQFMHDAENISG